VPRARRDGAESEARLAVFDATIEGWQDDYDVVFPYFETPT
jgi:hypothetical protein